jgi:hypothetical protein
MLSRRFALPGRSPGSLAVLGAAPDSPAFPLTTQKKGWGTEAPSARGGTRQNAGRELGAAMRAGGRRTSSRLRGAAASAARSAARSSFTRAAPAAAPHRPHRHAAATAPSPAGHTAPPQRPLPPAPAPPAEAAQAKARQRSGTAPAQSGQAQAKPYDSCSALRRACGGGGGSGGGGGRSAVHPSEDGRARRRAVRRQIAATHLAARCGEPLRALCPVDRCLRIAHGHGSKQARTARGAVPVDSAVRTSSRRGAATRHARLRARVASTGAVRGPLCTPVSPMVRPWTTRARSCPRASSTRPSTGRMPAHRPRARSTVRHRGDRIRTAAIHACRLTSVHLTSAAGSKP